MPKHWPIHASVDHFYLTRSLYQWGYVAPVVAAVVTRATGVGHIYLIISVRSYQNASALNNQMTSEAIILAVYTTVGSAADKNIPWDSLG